MRRFITLVLMGLSLFAGMQLEKWRAEHSCETEVGTWDGQLCTKIGS